MQGNILDAKEHTIVIPVNCVGVMGAGLAKAAADKWPWINPIYKKWCVNHYLKPGSPRYIWFNDSKQQICLFPTKQDWKEPSKLIWILQGLADIDLDLTNYSKAFPLLGCGLGGLNPNLVRPIIQAYISKWDNGSVIYTN